MLRQCIVHTEIVDWNTVGSGACSNRKRERKEKNRISFADFFYSQFSLYVSSRHANSNQSLVCYSIADCRRHTSIIFHNLQGQNVMQIIIYRWNFSTYFTLNEVCDSETNKLDVFFISCNTVRFMFMQVYRQWANISEQTIYCAESLCNFNHSGKLPKQIAHWKMIVSFRCVQCDCVLVFGLYFCAIARLQLWVLFVLNCTSLAE